MNRLIQTAVDDNRDICDAVREQVKDIHVYLKAWNAILKDEFNAKLLPIYDAGYISLDKQFLTIGINGFVEGCEFLGYTISPDDQNYVDFTNKVLKVIYDENKADRSDGIMFNTEYVPAENLGVKNDGSITHVCLRYITKADTSTQFPEWKNPDAPIYYVTNGDYDYTPALNIDDFVADTFETLYTNPVYSWQTKKVCGYKERPVTLTELLNHFTPVWHYTYLTNGEFYKKEFFNDNYDFDE